MPDLAGATKVMRGRVLLYVLAFPGALALDIVTPLGIADWLVELTLVWVASVWGTKRETRVVLAIACVTLIAGFWWSPVVEQPAWLDALNRLMAVGVMLTMIHVSDRRRAAEEAEKKAEGEIRMLKGLLPICASCKAIRGAAGEWHKLETYLSTNSEAQFTHGLCPACAAKYMEELSDQSEEE